MLNKLVMSKKTYEKYVWIFLSFKSAPISVDRRLKVWILDGLIGNISSERFKQSLQNSFAFVLFLGTSPPV